MVKLGLIGLGRWGTNVKRTLEDIGGVTVETFEKTSPLTPLLVKERGIQAVVVATPGSTHAKIALPFIKQGLPTFIEKPLATTLTDARKIEKAAQLARRSLAVPSEALREGWGGGRVMVGHIHLYNPAYRKAKQLAQKAGPLRSLHFESMNNGPIRDDMSALWDWAPHDVALALDLLGTMPKSVQAWGLKALRPHTKLWDTVLIKLTFPRANTKKLLTPGPSPQSGERNISCSIHVSWLSPEKRKKLTIIGARDTIVFDDTSHKKITLYKNMGPSVRGNTITVQQPTISHPPYGKTSPLELELRAFLKMVKSSPASPSEASGRSWDKGGTGGSQPSTKLVQGVAVVQLIEAAETSIAKSGKLIRL